METKTQLTKAQLQYCKNPEYYKTKSRLWRKENPEKYSAQIEKEKEKLKQKRIQSSSYREEQNRKARENYHSKKVSTRERLMVTSSKRRAKKYNIPHNISEKDIYIPEICPILKIPLQCNEGKMLYNSPSLDRIKPELGYVKGNVQVISSKANLMKTNATKEWLVKFANWILQNQDIL